MAERTRGKKPPAEKRTVYRYTVVLEPEPDGGLHAFCPALRGCHTHGRNRQEALARIREAMQAYLTSLQKHGEQIPPEDSAELVEVAA